jgi:hypothetical protein
MKERKWSSFLWEINEELIKPFEVIYRVSKNLPAIFYVSLFKNFSFNILIKLYFFQKNKKELDLK